MGAPSINRRLNPPDPNFPRMMFHRTLPFRVVNSQDELDDLGPEWSKTVIPAEAVSAAPLAAEAPPVKRKRGRPAAPKPPVEPTPI